MIAIAAGIRLIFELLFPVMPYLLGGIIVFGIYRVVRWYRELW
jgi:hypothetical protein